MIINQIRQNISITEGDMYNNTNTPLTKTEGNEEEDSYYTKVCLLHSTIKKHEGRKTKVSDILR